ncbi:hypothetical protein ANO11243_012770 [Dothideomycetidae sp. 11243]|nr:hypothetical protein ANO11243_012770 [fungal sp. No.11243]
MNANEISRYGKRFVQYFWDPLPANESTEAIWCLGQRYDSHPIRSPQHGRDLSSTSDTSSPPSSVPSAVDSAVSSSKETETDTSSIDIVERTESAERDEALSKGWPGAFVDDIETRIWLTYRNGFPTIAKSTDPAALSAMSFATRIKQLGNQSGFTSDTGWGCMIRSGQSLLANTLAMLELGREWRRGDLVDNEQKLLGLFADDPAAPFSIHRFVDYGASACGKHPGEWFGPSATARCIQHLTNNHKASNLRVYVRDDSDIYGDSFLATARSSSATFQPTLILLGTRLGIDRINPVYHCALSRTLTCSQSVGIAGGRPSSSHYFVGVQGNSFFYLDPHHTRPLLHKEPKLEDVASCHTRRLRKIDVLEMDPSMLLGFLIRSEAEWREWRAWISNAESVKGTDGRGKPIVHVHDHEPSFGEEARGQRADALDEVVSCEDSDDETVVS